MVLSFNKKNTYNEGFGYFFKFLGCYDQWKKIVEKYRLGWTVSDNGAVSAKGLEIFRNIYGKNNLQDGISIEKRIF